MRSMTTAGVILIMSRSPRVESPASTPTLQVTMTTIAANQPPRSHVAEILFNMISTLVQVGLDSVVMRSARGTVAVPAHANVTRLSRGARRHRRSRAMAIAFLADAVEIEAD